MEERAACALLKSRFEAAGFHIEENRPFDEDGVRFEIDGFDPEHRVGYEYVTSEAGDGWDVDGAVIAKLEERKKKGDLYVLVVDETEAPDEASLRDRAEAFLEELREVEIIPEPAASEEHEDAEPEAEEPEQPTKKAVAKPATAKPPTAKSKPAAKKPAKPAKKLVAKKKPKRK